MPPPITHFRRYQSYDYNRGAVEFISFHLKKRLPTFGEITPDGKMCLSQAGKILEEVILYEGQRATSHIDLKRYCIMPEHLHLRLYIQPNTPSPLKALGQFISNVKRWSIKKCAENGISISWQENYHDRLCLTRDVISLVDEYIDLNPMKWALMHSQEPPMKVIEPLESPLLPRHEWWSGVGNANLLNGSRPLLAIRLSRSLAPDDDDIVLLPIIEECRRGAIPISTFISPLERALFQRLCAFDLPCICAVPDPLKTIYRPRVEQTLLFARQRLLLLSHPQAEALSRESAWHNINDDLAKIAYASNGRAIYLK